jgi:hypothetical protein
MLGAESETWRTSVQAYDTEGPWEKTQRGDESPGLQQPVLICYQTFELLLVGKQLTLVLCVPSINTCTGNEDFIDNGEDTFTTNPFSISASNPSVMKDSGLI